MMASADSAEPDVVCFGMITPATVFVVDELPAYNAGVQWKHKADFISDDAAIIALLLKQWGVPTGLIGTTLGDDEPGRRAAQQLSEAGVKGEFRLSKTVTTSYEINISDRTGARTYFWKRDPSVLATLDTADLSMISGARILYVDWYDGDHVLRAMKKARRHDVPVFLNLEYGHEDPALVRRYAPYVSTCQAVTDASQVRNNAQEVALRLLEAGIPTVIVTMAGKGCLVATAEQVIHVQAPQVDVIDGCAAGATLSAGYLYGLLRGLGLVERVNFAVAAASLQCTQVGPIAFHVNDIETVAAGLPAPIDLRKAL